MNISRSECVNADPWMLNEACTIGKEKTPLPCFVAKAGLLYMFDIFMKRKFNFKVVDHFGNSPLHYAAEKSSCEMVEKLLELGLDPLLCNYKKQTPLLFAVMCGQHEHVKYLSSAMFIADDVSNGPIHYAVLSKDTKMLKLLVDNTPEMNNMITEWIVGYYYESREYHLNYFNEPPLCMAVSSMDFKTAECLVELGAKVNEQVKETLASDRKTPKEDMLKMWSILSKDIDVYRNMDSTADRYTGLLSGESKYLTLF